jgi:hypothetical protein
MSINSRPPLVTIEKLILVTIVRYYKDIVADYIVEKAFRPDIGNYYRVNYTIAPNVDFNLFETNFKVLNIYSDTYEKLSNYLGIDRKFIKIHMSHWFFNIRKLNNSLVLRTSRLI